MISIQANRCFKRVSPKNMMPRMRSWPLTWISIVALVLLVGALSTKYNASKKEGLFVGAEGKTQGLRSSTRSLLSRESGLVDTLKSYDKALSNLKPQGKHYKLAIAVISAFDWEDTTHIPPHLRRQSHRNTWMKHPAVGNDVLVYFIIGNQQQKGVQGNPEDADHDISELFEEMKHENDIVLLNSSDVHDYGKMDAWYVWAANNVNADYHLKLDVESYVHVDRLLATLDAAPINDFIGGTGWRLDYDGTVTEIPFIRGIASIMSNDLIKGLAKCISSGYFGRNNGDFEEVHQALGLRTCGLDANLTYSNEMPIYMLTQLLIQGCRNDWVDKAIAIHGGSEYSRLADVLFYRLNDIYFPEKGDLTPSWAKWESLRLQFLEDMNVCDTIIRSEWACESYEYRLSCAPDGGVNAYDAVFCGEHGAASCQLCPQGRGESFCGGDCIWCENMEECMSQEDFTDYCTKDMKVKNRKLESPTSPPGRHLSSTRRPSRNVKVKNRKLESPTSPPGRYLSSTRHPRRNLSSTPRPRRLSTSRPRRNLSNTMSPCRRHLYGTNSPRRQRESTRSPRRRLAASRNYHTRLPRLHRK